MTRTLLPVSADNVKRFADLRRTVSTEEVRNYMATIDYEAVVLREGTDYFFEDDAGQMTAAVSIVRNNDKTDTPNILISVDVLQKDPRTLTDAACDALRSVEDTYEQSTIIKLIPPEDVAFVEQDLQALGFEKKASNYRYIRPAGPVEPDQFPHAQRALDKGYTSIILDDDFIKKTPDIFEQLTDIHNRAFASWETTVPTAPERIRALYEGGANVFFIGMLGDEIVANVVSLNLGAHVLSPRLATLRKHWGSGVTDLVSRHLINDAAKRWNLPVLAYVDARNAASWKALERFGFERVHETIQWERHIPAGNPFRI